MTLNEGNAKALARLEESIGYSFKSKELLRQALTHSSYRYEHSLPIGTDNESLEFLGDAILGFIMSRILYERLPNAEVGTLAKIKSYLVCAKTLYLLAEKLDLGEYLLLSKGEVKTKGREKQSVIVNSYEALISAIYLDSGLSTTEKFITSQFEVLINNVINEGKEFRDYKSMLQEYLQSMKLPEPTYHVIREEGPDHNKTYLVKLIVNQYPLAQAEGKSKKDAEELAAKKGLELLKENPDKVEL